MKNYQILFLALSLVFASCIKDELPNAEANIIDCIVSGIPPDVLNEVLVRNKTVTIYIKPGTRDSVKAITPDFLLSEGANVYPPNGTICHFENADTAHYTITSQNGKWKKTYTLTIAESFVLTQNTFSFEHYETKTDKPYFHRFYEQNTGNKQFIWSSGNAGFGIVNGDKQPEEYPTSSYANGKIGKGVRLTTSSTGELGAWVQMPIAAGNLFLGDFDISKAMSATLQATQFGLLYALSGKPEELRFWYKYQRGAVYKDKDGKVLDKQDAPDIYAVLYEPVIKPDGTVEKLDGTNVTTAENIVSIAQLDPANIVNSDNLETAEYRQLPIPFVKRKEINPEKLNNGGYLITIVFASSIKGGLFEGAVGSTLLIDEVEIICK